MARARLITAEAEARVLEYLGRTRYAARDAVMFLLSARAALRACEISRLRWADVLDARGAVGDTLRVERGAKGGEPRAVPMSEDLRAALAALAKLGPPEPTAPVVASERGGPMSAGTISDWFARTYARLGLAGLSSHSGRRTAATRWARVANQCGGSIVDAQRLLGHRWLSSTMVYVEGCPEAQRRMVKVA